MGGYSVKQQNKTVFDMSQGRQPHTFSPWLVILLHAPLSLFIRPHAAKLKPLPPGHF